MFLVISILHGVISDTVVAICVEILAGGGMYVVMSGVYTYQRNREMLKSIIREKEILRNESENETMGSILIGIDVGFAPERGSFWRCAGAVFRVIRGKFR